MVICRHNLVTYRIKFIKKFVVRYFYLTKIKIMKFSITKLIVAAIILTFTPLNAQVGIGTTSPNQSSMLEVTSTNSGLLIPRVSLLSNTDVVTITTPATSLLVYNIGFSPNGYYYWNGTSWVQLAVAGESTNWSLLGNTGTTSGTNYLGTTDPIDLRFKTGATNRWNISHANDGQLQSYSLGTATLPIYSFQTDQNTGLYSSGADAIDVTTGGTARLRFPSTNQVHALSLGTAALPFYSFNGQTTTGIFGIATDNLGFSTAAIERMRIEPDGDIGIGVTPNASAKLDISANNRGLLIPNVALTAKNIAGPIAAPATSLLVYNTATSGISPNNVLPGFHYWNGAAWAQLAVATASTDWSLLGNTGTTAANFIGTTDAIAFRMYANNVERMRINPADGEVVVGAVASPYAGDAFSAVATPTLPFALNGYSAQNGSGTWGEILTGSTTAFSAVQGVYGGSGVGAGALGNYNGTNTSGTRSGVLGICSTPTASNGGAGVQGFNSIATGNQHMGVLGQYNGSSFGIGVIGIGFGGAVPTGNTDFAVVGWRANNQNYSGYFNGNHVIANGTKTASVGTSKGNQLLYVTELPEVWFEDIGRGKLVNGSVEIKLDPLFLETIFIDETHPMSVFLQEEGDSNGLYVIPGKDGFTVKEKNQGTSNITFSYRIMAKRLHFQDHRFGNDPLWGEGDTRVYNQYATPPPVDHNENVRFQEEQKKNYKPSPMPKGFTDYFQLQNEAKKLEKEKTTKSD